MPLLHIPALPRHTTPCLTAPDQTGPDLAKTCRTEPGLAALAYLVSRRRPPCGIGDCSPISIPCPTWPYLAPPYLARPLPAAPRWPISSAAEGHPRRTPPKAGGVSIPCLATPRPTLPCQTLPDHSWPHHATPSPVISSIPNQLAPVGWNDTIFERLRDHPSVPIVCPQDMAATAKGTEVAKTVVCSLTTLDVVDVGFVEFEWCATSNAFPPVSFPHDTA